MPDRVKEKLSALLYEASRGADMERYIFDQMADYLIANGVTVLQWIPVSEPPKEPGEYTVAQQHWCDGHLESKKGKWNGVEWFVDGRESLMIAYWMPPLPLPDPPKGE